MEVSDASDILKQQEVLIPKPIEVRAVRDLIMGGIVEPNRLEDEFQPFETSSSLMEICDHLAVRCVSSEDYKGMEVVEEVVATENTASLFAPEVGDKITVIKVRRDMSIAEMAEMVAKISEIADTKIKNPVDIDQMKRWAERMKKMSQNLREAGLAMKRVEMLVQRTKPSEDVKENGFDRLYNQAASMIYDLGEAINIERRGDTLPELLGEYERLHKEKGDSGIDAALADGLKFARFGMTGRDLGDSAALEFDRMARLYSHVSKHQNSVRIEEIIDTVVKRSIPYHSEKVQQARAESETRVAEIPHAMVGEVVLRGIQMAYRELPIPPVIKLLLQTDVYRQSELEFVAMIGRLDEFMGPESIKSIVYEFSDGGMGTIGRQSVGGVADHNGILSQILRENGRDVVMKLLTKWRIRLDTLGLGRDDIEKFSQWFEDRNFVSGKLAQLEDSISGPDYTWKSEKEIKSVAAVVHYYEKKLSSGEAVEEEYARFQKAMLLIVIDQMRLNYGGWIEGDRFTALQETSPSKITKAMRLNCVGRSNMLLAIGDRLGLTGYGASRYGHSTAIFDFANGDKKLVEASVYRGYEFRDVLRREDTGDLLRTDEAVYDGDDEERYLVVTKEMDVIRHVVMNYEAYFSDQSMVGKTYEFEPNSTEISNIFSRIDARRYSEMTMEGAAKAMGISTADVSWLLRRLAYLCPYYIDKIISDKNRVAFIEMMKRLMTEAGE